VERDNPNGVWISSRSTARATKLPSGTGMTQEANASKPKGNRKLSREIPYNWLDRAIPNLKGC
jgi:hypothetical protein